MLKLPDEMIKDQNNSWVQGLINLQVQIFDGIISSTDPRGLGSVKILLSHH